jgi:aryl-alcohol dehydrogenase-like predicted oxidoreductase
MYSFSIAGEMNVNRMGFGAMRITGKGVFGPPADKKAALAVLKRAVELGVNFIDTADSYGPAVSEELIAEALYPYPKDLVIATKGGLERPGPDVWTQNGQPAHLEKVLNESLKRLKLDTIDLYQLHRIDAKVPAEKTFAFLQKAQQEGKVRHLGLSEVNVDQIKHAQQFFKVVSVQNKYSVDNRQWEPVLQYCLENDIAFIPWYPLNAGNVKTQSILQNLAGRKSISVHQLALSWLLHHAPNILLIPGTSSVAHLEENVAAASVSLSNDDMIELDELSA